MCLHRVSCAPPEYDLNVPHSGPEEGARLSAYPVETHAGDGTRRACHTLLVSLTCLWLALAPFIFAWSGGVVSVRIDQLAAEENLISPLARHIARIALLASGPAMILSVVAAWILFRKGRHFGTLFALAFPLLYGFALFLLLDYISGFQSHSEGSSGDEASSPRPYVAWEE
jgi:hypothetical protein